MEDTGVNSVEFGEECRKCLICERVFATIVALIIHLLAHVTTTVLVCNGWSAECRGEFADERELLAHTWSVHAPGTAASEEDIVPDDNNFWLMLQRGLMWKRGNVRYRCFVCGKLFKLFSWMHRCLDVHWKADPGKGRKDLSNLFHRHDLRTKCATCGGMYSHEEIASHGCDVFGEYPCEWCEARFASLPLKADHVTSAVRMHGDMCRSCPVCGELFHVISLLEQHLQTHSAVPHSVPMSYTTCMTCKRIFRETQIYDHGCKEIGFYKCTNCGERYRDMDRYYEHLQSVHGREPPSLRCNVCSELCHSHRALMMHKYKHGKPPRQRCKHCGKQDRNTLTHTCNGREKSVRCEICAKWFSSPDLLKIHGNNVHAAVKKFVCEQCGKAFKMHHHLCNHVASLHSTDRQYMCSHCPQAFKLKAHLVVHERIHTGDKPLKCGHCQEGFKDYSRLISHRKTHEKHETREKNIFEEKSAMHEDPHITFC